MKNLMRIVVFTFIFSVFFSFIAFAGIDFSNFNVNGVEDSMLKITTSSIAFENEEQTRLELLKEGDEYIINIFVDLTPSEESELTDSDAEVLKTFCNEINSNLYNFLMDDYKFEKLEPNTYTTENGFDIMVEEGYKILTYKIISHS